MPGYCRHSGQGWTRRAWEQSKVAPHGGPGKSKGTVPCFSMASRPVVGTGREPTGRDSSASWNPLLPLAALE